jgi:starvation-inducible DNA-binding protein
MPIIPPMPPDTATRMVALLQPAMTEMIELSLLAKMGHWCMQGHISFVAVHRFMDELVDFARDEYDTLAERIIQLGQFPDGRLATVAARAGLRPFEPEAISPAAVPAAIVPNLLVLARRNHERSVQAAEDPITQNILIDVSQQLDKLCWFWQASQS